MTMNKAPGASPQAKPAHSDAAPAGARPPVAGGAKPAPIAPAPQDIVADAYTLGGESRYQVKPEEAMRWIEERMERVPPEHKHAWQTARLMVNKRM